METTARKNNYLRALPYRSPEEQAAEAERLLTLATQLAARSARLRRWTFGLAASAAVAVVVIVVAVYLLSNRASATAVAETNPAPATNSGHQAKKDSPPSTANSVATNSVAGNASLKIQPTPIKEVNVLAPALPKPSADLTHKDIYLEALGGLSAAHLYQTYLNIGLLADGVESKAYSTDEARNSLGVIANFMDLVEAKLTKLERTALDADDQESLSRIKAVTGLLRLQTKSLFAYWDSGNMEHADQYHAARKAAWSGLSKVLGLDSE